MSNSLLMNLIVKASTFDATSNLQKLKGQLQDIDNTASNMSGLSSIGGKLQNIGGKMSTVGRNMTTGITLPLVGIGAAATSTAMTFEAKMSEVQAISGATGSDFDALVDKAKEMGRTTKFTASESAEAFKYMGMAGWDSQEMIAGIPGVLDLAAASGTDLATTSDIVTDALTAFGLEAEDTSHFVDLLAQVSRNSNTNVEMLGESFKYAAPVANTLGMTAEDTAFALGLMANAGIKSSQAGTSLRSGLTRLAKPTKEMKEYMDKYNISLTDNEGNVKSLRTFMQDLRNSMAGLDETEQSAALSAIFGKNAFSGWAAIVNSSDKDFNDLSAAIDDCDGSASEMATTMMDNAQGALTKMKSALEGAAITIGESFAPWVTKAADKISELAQKFQSLDKEDQEFIIKLAAIVAAAGPVLSIVGKLTYGVGGLLKIIGGASGAFSAVAGGASTVVSSLGGMIAAAGPVGLAIAGIVAALGIMGAALYVNYQKQTKYRKELQKTFDAQDESLAKYDEQAKMADTYKDKLNELIDKEDKTVEDKQKIHYWVDQLNDIIPDLNLAYDDEADKLNKTNDELEKSITNYKKQAKAAAYKEQMTDIVKTQIDYEEKLAEAQRKREEVQKRIDELESKKNKNKFDIEELGRLQGQYEDLSSEINQYKLNITDCETRFDAWADKAEDASARTKNTWKELQREAEEAGWQIPYEIETGIMKGNIAIPQSLNELQALLDPEYAALAEQAQMMGMDIPEGLRESFENGEITVDQGIGILFDSIKQEIANRDMEIKSMQGEEGKEAMKAYSEAMKNNTNLVKNAKELAAFAGDEHFQQAIKFANINGVSIDKEYAKGILAKAETPEEAALLLTQYVLDELEKTKQAEYEGTSLSEGYALGIKKGKAPARAQAYATALFAVQELKKGSKDADKAGELLGQGFVNGIEKFQSRAYNAAANLASHATFGMTDFLKIMSPSRVAAEIGEYFGLGFAKGITSNKSIGAVNNSVSDLADAAVTGLPGYSATNGRSISQLHNTHQAVSTASAGMISAPTDNISEAIMALAPYLADGVNKGIDNLTLEVDGRQFGRMVTRYA